MTASYRHPDSPGAGGAFLPLWWPWAQELWQRFHAQSDEIQLVEAILALLALVIGPLIRFISARNARDLSQALEEPLRRLYAEDLLDRARGTLKDVPFVERGGPSLSLLRSQARLMLTGRAGLGKTWEASQLAPPRGGHGVYRYPPLVNLSLVRYQQKEGEAGAELFRRASGAVHRPGPLRPTEPGLAAGLHGGERAEAGGDARAAGEPPAAGQLAARLRHRHGNAGPIAPAPSRGRGDAGVVKAILPSRKRFIEDDLSTGSAPPPSPSQG